jgi:hypothetical protein
VNARRISHSSQTSSASSAICPNISILIPSSALPAQNTPYTISVSTPVPSVPQKNHISTTNDASNVTQAPSTIGPPSTVSDAVLAGNITPKRTNVSVSINRYSSTAVSALSASILVTSTTSTTSARSAQKTTSIVSEIRSACLVPTISPTSMVTSAPPAPKIQSGIPPTGIARLAREA